MKHFLAVLLLLVAATAGADVYAVPPQNGVGGLGCTALSCTFTVPILGPAAPNCTAIPFSFTGDTDTGMCSSSINNVELWANNTRTLSVRDTAVQIFAATTIFETGTAAAPGIKFTTVGNTGLSASAGPDTLRFSVVTAERAAISSATTLTESAATTAATVQIASGSSAGGSLEYTIVARDATDSQTRHGSFHFAAGNKSGTETCTISAATEAADGSVLATTEAAPGTLTYGITCDTSGANAIALRFNVASSLTQTSLTINKRMTLDCDPVAAASCVVVY